MSGRGLQIVVLTTTGDRIGATSPVRCLRSEGLAHELQANGHRLHEYRLPVPESPGLPSYTAAADIGKRLAMHWAGEGSGPDVILCDGYRSGFAGHALAGRVGARVVLWLGTTSTPVEETERRLAAAVARSSTVVATTSGTAERLHEASGIEAAALVPPAVDQALIIEPRPWRMRQSLLDLGPRDASELVVAVCAPSTGPGEDRAAMVDFVRGVVPASRVALVDHDRRQDGRTVPDIAVTGLTADGGRAILRAMAQGSAVITLAMPPDRDLMVHRATGLEVRTSRQLVAALRELRGDPFLREALGEGALDKIRTQHSSRVVAQQLTAVLGRLVRGPGDNGEASPPPMRAATPPPPAA